MTLYYFLHLKILILFVLQKLGYIRTFPTVYSVQMDIGLILSARTETEEVGVLVFLSVTVLSFQQFISLLNLIHWS